MVVAVIIEVMPLRREATGDRSTLASPENQESRVDQERLAQRALTRPRKPHSAKRDHQRRAESPRRRSTSSKLPQRTI